MVASEQRNVLRVLGRNGLPSLYHSLEEGSLMIGTYPEYFLLLGQGAYHDESKIVIYNVCNSDAVLTIGIWDMDSFAIAFFVTNLH